MYELARGPLMWASALIFLAGVIYRAVQLYMLTEKKERSFYNPVSKISKDAGKISPEERKTELLISFQNSLLGKHPIMAIVSTIFHICLFASTIFLAAHNLLIYESWGITFLSIPDGLADVLTIILLACALFFLIRRLLIPQVQAISGVNDYFLLFITIIPFLTGFFAYHQWFDYKTVLIIHILASELMLIAIPFTKLGHMVFFFFVRILFGSEYSFWRGNRKWSS
jgi:nitrate reductase gamma subunit